MKRNSLVLKYEVDACPVCLEEIKNFNKSVTVPCLHIFCLQCIGRWLHDSANTNCPLCKQQIKSIAFNITSEKKYANVGFPRLFSTAWTIRQQVKNVVNDYDCNLNLINLIIKQKKSLLSDKNVIGYMLYLGGMKARLNLSRASDEAVAVKRKLLWLDKSCWQHMESVLATRLSILLIEPHSRKLLATWEKLCCNKSYQTTVLDRLKTAIKKDLDPERAELLCMEAEAALLGEGVVTDFYVDPGSMVTKLDDGQRYVDLYGTVIRVIGGDCKGYVRLPDVAGGLLTLLLMTVNVSATFSDLLSRLRQVGVLTGRLQFLKLEFCSWVDIEHWLRATAYILLRLTGFYVNKHLRQSSAVALICGPPVTPAVVQFIKFSLEPELLSGIISSAYEFRRRVVLQPFIVTEECVDLVAGDTDSTDTLSLAAEAVAEEEADNNDVTVVAEYVNLVEDSDSDVEIVAEIFPTPRNVVYTPLVTDTEFLDYLQEQMHSPDRLSTPSNTDPAQMSPQPINLTTNQPSSTQIRSSPPCPHPHNSSTISSLSPLSNTTENLCPLPQTNVNSTSVYITGPSIVVEDTVPVLDVPTRTKRRKLMTNLFHL